MVSFSQLCYSKCYIKIISVNHLMIVVWMFVLMSSISTGQTSPRVGKLRQSYYLCKMLYLQPGALSGDLGTEHTHQQTHTHTQTHARAHTDREKYTCTKMSALMLMASCLMVFVESCQTRICLFSQFPPSCSFSCLFSSHC